MRLTGLLKEKFDKAITIEEKRNVFKEVGIELNDNELNFISGGACVGGDIDWDMSKGYTGPCNRGDIDWDMSKGYTGPCNRGDIDWDMSKGYAGPCVRGDIDWDMSKRYAGPCVREGIN